MGDQSIRKQPVAVIGASGLVGGAILRECQRRGLPAIGTHHRHVSKGTVSLDMKDGSAVDRFLDKTDPSVVVCAAAETHVDWAESHADVAAELNVMAVERLARRCADRTIDLVFISSDYVFDGVSGPYREDDRPNPINVYGAQKLTAEKIVQAAQPSALIVRTTVVFGWEQEGKNFVLRLVRALREGKTVTVPSDQISTPTYAPDLAKAIIELAMRGETGIINVAGPATMTRSEFAAAVAAAFGLDGRQISRVTTAELGQAAARPIRAGLVTDRLQAVAGHLMRGPLPALQGMADSENVWDAG